MLCHFAAFPGVVADFLQSGRALRRGFREESVTDLLLGGLLLDEAVAVEVIAGLKGKERGHPHDHRAEDLITDVEIVVGEPRLLDHGPEAEALRHGREQFNLSRFYAIAQIEYYRNFNFKPLPHPQALPSAAVSSACGC